jgi:glycosyltransferase involved in cell wall biosynthesis
MQNPFSDLSIQSLFLVWGPPSHGPRSQVFARELGIRELHFVHLRARRGLLTAPLRYGYQAVQTLRLLFQKRPRLVFVQNPPSFAIVFVFIYCALTRSSFVVDAHSGAFQAPYWARPQWLYRFLARQAVLTIVTNEHFEGLVKSWGAEAFILRDIPTSFDRANSYPMKNGFNVAVVNTFSPDEPLNEVLQAAARLDDVHFYITGKVSKANPEIMAQASVNVHFTDFLPDDQYYALLSTSNAIMCLTTRDHTMQRGACEALSLGKPIITSDWPILREYFRKGAVHVPNNEDGIRQGVEEIKNHYALYQAGIQELQVSQRREWESKLEELTRRIKQGARRT